MLKLKFEIKDKKNRYLIKDLYNKILKNKILYKTKKYKKIID